jgi:gamma-glutamyl:cysteine ligase YbdK (ATP-grasp superfamily)
MHLNLPFSGDAELARLHAAVRVVLPLLPALAASSPVCDGEATGMLDTRLEHYRTNQALVPSIAGQIIPEPIVSRAEYEARILEPMWRDVAPHDPDGLLRHEFLNSRGAIVRFDRSAVEIRLIDMQETPRVDLALARVVTGAVRALVDGRWARAETTAAIPTETLARLLAAAVTSGPAAPVDDPDVARAFGAEPGTPMGAVWQRVGETVLAADDAEAREWLRLVGRRGTLAERLLRRLGPAPSRERIVEVYLELATRLVEDRAFA